MFYKPDADDCSAYIQSQSAADSGVGVQSRPGGRRDTFWHKVRRHLGLRDKNVARSRHEITAERALNSPGPIFYRFLGSMQG